MNKINVSLEDTIELKQLILDNPDLPLVVFAGEYANSGDMDCDIENSQEKIVKCRKPHECMGGCNTEIKVGNYALCETGFVDDKPVSCYTCMPCIEAWLEESGQVEAEECED